ARPGGLPNHDRRSAQASPQLGRNEERPGFAGARRASGAWGPGRGPRGPRSGVGTRSGAPGTSMPFVAVAQVEDIAVGKGTLVESRGTTVAVFNGGSGRFYACGAICPHEDGPLAEGW